MHIGTCIRDELSDNDDLPTGAIVAIIAAIAIFVIILVVSVAVIYIINRLYYQCQKKNAAGIDYNNDVNNPDNSGIRLGDREVIINWDRNQCNAVVDRNTDTSLATNGGTSEMENYPAYTTHKEPLKL